MTVVISTCDLCDTHQADTSSAFHGPVTTVKCCEDNTPMKPLLESDGTADTPQGRIGHVLVVDGGGSLRRALVGANIAASAARNGWAGVVVDGCMRDRAELAAADVGLMALALNPMPTDRKVAGLTGVGVQIQGVWVQPGDWLAADEDGVEIRSPSPVAPLGPLGPAGPV